MLLLLLETCSVILILTVIYFFFNLTSMFNFKFWGSLGMRPWGHHITNNNDIIYIDKNHPCLESTNIVYKIIIIFIPIKTNTMK